MTQTICAAPQQRLMSPLAVIAGSMFTLSSAAWAVDVAQAPSTATAVPVSIAQGGSKLAPRVASKNAPAKGSAAKENPLVSAESAVWIERAKAGQFPAPIASMVSRGQGVRVLDVFPAPGGLIGYVVAASTGEQRIYYVTQDGSSAIYGLAFDSQLNNLTAQHIAAYTNPLSLRVGVGTLATGSVATAPSVAQAPTAVPASTRPEPQGMTNQILSPAWNLAVNAKGGFVEGRGLDVYIVFDPSCPFCHKVWKTTRPLLNALRIHWVPVAELGERSRLLAQAFMTMPDQSKPAAMDALANRTLPAASQVSQDVSRVLAMNNAILEAANVKNVPLIMYVDRGSIRSMVGAPNQKQLKELLEASAGMAR